MNVGFDRPLYILPFDHRGSFQTGMFGWKGPLSPEQSLALGRSLAEALSAMEQRGVAHCDLSGPNSE